MRLEVRIDAADVTLAKQGEGYVGDMAVTFAGYLPNTGWQTSDAVAFTPHLTAETREKAMKEGLMVTRAIALPLGMEKLRAVVYDRTSGAVGSLTTPAK